MYSQLDYDERKILKCKLELMYCVNFVIQNKNYIKYIINNKHNILYKLNNIYNIYEIINTNLDFIKIKHLDQNLLNIENISPEDIQLILARMSGN